MTADPVPPGHLVRECMKKRCLSDRQLSHLAGYPMVKTKRFLEGKHATQLEMVADYAVAVGLDMGQLMKAELRWRKRGLGWKKWATGGRGAG